MSIKAGHRREVHDSQNVTEFRLVGPAGEPIDLWRTLDSHGLNSLPPQVLNEHDRTLEVTLPTTHGRPRTVRISAGRTGFGRVQVLGRKTSPKMLKEVGDQVRHLLRLDEDLSGFYDQISEDPNLQWARKGAGRLMRSATVYEDVIKTICTTNCAWSATVRMVQALCEHLGDPAPGAPETGWEGRTFPTPEQMASVAPGFYQDIVRAGYRSRYLREIAQATADGDLDLEQLGRMTADELPDQEVEARLLALPGVGPYAAAHIMLLLGRYSRLILDSWTRPKFASLVDKKSVSDQAIRRRFKSYGQYAGLAFWLFVTRDWVDE